MPCPDAETLARFTQGFLTGDPLEVFERHLAGCESCLRVIGELASRDEASPDVPASRAELALIRRGDVVGRYVVLDLLGSGGMGHVYTAYDPLLDRRVALKLLRPSGPAGDASSEQDRSRLVREAQALARVSHPNVVAVYDVGTVGEQVFMAFERVEGTSLGEWSKQRRRWSEIRDAFVEAGRGLAAAHAAGVVHRDFKPDNVLVGADGRVRVADFGPVFGTAGYMPPEVLAGEPADARSDQFSFCVSLYESLYGSKPFRDGELAPAGGRVAHRTLPEPSGGRPPARLRSALMRGLERRPEQRFASMDALLGALLRNPVRRAVPFVAAGLGLCVVAGSVAGAGYAARAEGRQCQGAEARLAPAWNDARRGAARRAFEATGLPYADDSWRATEQTLSAYASSWVAMRTEACESARVRREQSVEAMELRIDCLDRRARDLSLLMDTLANADARVVEHAVAAEDLPSLAACADVEALRRPQRPPADAVKRERLERMRATVAGARALLAVGKADAARDLAAPLIAEAHELGHRPFEAEALFVLGDAQSEAGDYASAARSLQDAALAAEVGRDVRLEALAYLKLAMVSGPIQRRFDQGATSCAHVRACLEQLGRDVEIEAGVIDVEAQLAYLAGRLEDSVAMLTRAIQLLEPVAGTDDRHVAAMRSFVGFVLADLGRFPEAVRVEQQALDSRRRALGAAHPEVARSLTNLGLVHMELGDADHALDDFRAALAIWSSFDAAHPLAGFAEQGVADALLDLGRLEEARRAGDSALRTLSAGYGADHPRVASALLTQGRIALERGALDEAEGDYERALTLYEAPTSDPLRQALPLTGLGRVLLARTKPREAIAPLERAFLLLEKLPGDAKEHADLHIALARALWDGGGDRSRSLQLAGRALDEARHLPPQRPLRREIEAWLAARSEPGGRP